jgi:hypothetical protein
VNRAIMETQTTAATDAWTMYIYSLKSPVSKQKYPQRLAKFFAFADRPQDIPIEEQNNTIIQDCPCNGKGGMEAISQCFR